MVISEKLSHLPKVRISEVRNLQGDLKSLSDKNYKKLKRRLKKVGFKYPLYLWNNNGTLYNLDGNQRQKTILKAWGDIEVPYIEIEAENEIEAKKEILAISSQYGEVTKEGFYEFSSGFTTNDWDEIDTQTTFEGWRSPQEIEEDDFDVDNIDEVQTDIELGDLIEIGDHRLLCGDSTNILGYKKVCGDELFDLIITDPPYNVNYEGKTKDKLKIKNDQMGDDEFYKFLLQFFSASFEYTKMGGGMVYLARRFRRRKLSESNAGCRRKSSTMPYLGKKLNGYGPPRLPMETRALFVWMERRRKPQLVLGSKTDNRFKFRPTKSKCRAPNNEAAGINILPNKQLVQIWRYRWRSLLRQWINHGCQPAIGKKMLWNGA